MHEKSISIAVVGCGRIAQSLHMPALARAAGARVVALADADAAALAKAAAFFPSARRYDSYESAVEDAAVDAVVVCLPPHLHFDAAKRAVAAGKHVYVEKPLAVELDDANRLVEARRAAGTIGAVGFNYRADPAYVAMREAMQAEGTPPLVCARSVFCSAPAELPSWKTGSAGGGVLLDLASHHFDLYRYALGKRAVEIEARATGRKSAPDGANVDVQFEDGTTAQSHFAFATVDEDRFELYFEGAKASFDRYRKTHERLSAARFRYGRAARLAEGLSAAKSAFLRALSAPGEPSFEASLEAFIAAAAGRGAPLAGFEDGVASLAVVVAAQISAERGRSVRVEYPPA
jgi:predicted dehydrogenase